MIFSLDRSTCALDARKVRCRFKKNERLQSFASRDFSPEEDNQYPPAFSMVRDGCSRSVCRMSSPGKMMAAA